MAMAYKDDLKDPLWIAKRQEILERDNFQCTKCGIERPALRGLFKKFGIKNYTDFKKEGYQVSGKGYNSLHCYNKGWHYDLEYIGNDNIPFSIEKLHFAQRIGYNFLCFAEEVVDGTSLIDHNIHHKYYINNHKPWEYPNEALTSLCMKCHKQTHEDMTIPVFSQQGEQLYIAEVCHKCSGSGYISQYHYYSDGICFECWGNGVILMKVD